MHLQVFSSKLTLCLALNYVWKHVNMDWTAFQAINISSKEYASRHQSFHCQQIIPCPIAKNLLQSLDLQHCRSTWWSFYQNHFQPHAF